MYMKEVTVTSLWQRNSSDPWCWQRGQCDSTHASGVIISIIPNDSSCVTPIWSGVDLLMFLVSDDEITDLYLCHQHELQHFVFIYFWNDSRTTWLECVVRPKLIYLPLHLQVFFFLKQFCGTPQEERLTLPLAWFVNCVSVLGFSQTNLKCTINLLVLVKCLGA